LAEEISGGTLLSHLNGGADMDQGRLRRLSNQRGIPGIVVMLCGLVWHLLSIWDTASFALDRMILTLPAVKWLGNLASEPYWVFYVVGAAMLLLQYWYRDNDGELRRARCAREQVDPARYIHFTEPSVVVDAQAGHIEFSLPVINAASEDLNVREIVPDRKMSFVTSDNASIVPTRAAASYPVSDFILTGNTLFRSGERAVLTFRQHLPPNLMWRLDTELGQGHALFVLFQRCDLVLEGETLRFKVSIPDFVYHQARVAAVVGRR
jgi:hypothetical protein